MFIKQYPIQQLKAAINAICTQSGQHLSLFTTKKTRVAPMGRKRVVLASYTHQFGLHSCPNKPDTPKQCEFTSNPFVSVADPFRDADKKILHWVLCQIFTHLTGRDFLEADAN